MTVPFSGEDLQSNRFLAQKLYFGFQTGGTKYEIEVVGPPWRAPQRNSAQNPGMDVQNGGMATHLVKNWHDLGILQWIQRIQPILANGM